MQPEHIKKLLRPAAWVAAVPRMAMFRWYERLSGGKKRAVLVAAAGVALMLCLILVWQPLQRALTEAEQAHAEAAARLHWLQQHRSAPLVAAGRSERSLLSLIVRSARQNQIGLSQIQPEGDRVVSVTLQRMPFAGLVRWLQQIADAGYIGVDEASFTRADSAGLVDARIVFVQI